MSSEERWREIRRLVEAAMALPPNERAAFLQDSVQDESIRKEAAELLGFDDVAGDLFSVTAWRDGGPDVIRQTLPGEVIGHYRIVRELGRGGMGAVYLAERADGEYRQCVALKVLQDHVFDEEMVRRFRRERQILADLVHPGIARLLDGGVTESSRPFFAMEYVEGRRIDTYCDEERLDVAARLRLFIRVAEAVQAAHQRLVLHLDIKPANILVDGEGQPRLLDFGIAQLIEDHDGVKQADPSLLLMTPRYASPEQVAGSPLGVGSDIFSLCTLLYRMLTGVLPYPMEGVTPLEAARILREMPPQLPSSVVPEDVAGELCGDLDTILMQGLRKEPERRYPTVAALAEDIHRYLDGRPVVAHADSVRYRMSKFVGRHRVAVSIGAVAVLLLTLTTTLAIRSAVRAAKSQKVAEKRLRDVQNIAHSYVFDLDDQLAEVPGTLHVRSFVLANAKKYLDAMYGEDTSNDPVLAHDVVEGYTKIGRVQAAPAKASLSDPAGALLSKERALAIEQGLFKKHPDDLLERRHVVRMLYQNALGYNFNGDLARETALLHQAWDLGQPLIQPGSKMYRPLMLAVVTWAYAVDLCGNGDEWNTADPVGATLWLDRTQTLIDQYLQSTPPPAERDDLARRMQERVDLSRLVVLIHTGRQREVVSRLRELLAHTPRATNGDETSIEKSLRGYLTGTLLDLGDVKAAEAVVYHPAVADVHEKTADQKLKREEAEALVLQGRFALQEGRVAEGQKKVSDGLAWFDSACRTLHDNSQMCSNSAWLSLNVADEPSVDPKLRLQLYRRAIAIAEDVRRRHPEALSTAMLIGQCDLGMARISADAHDEAGRRTMASAAVGEFSRVLAAHPIQPEASALLTKARSL